MKPIMMLAGVAPGDFVDETMEDELNSKDIENDELQSDLKEVETKEDIVSSNTSCWDEKQMHSSSCTEANNDSEIVSAITDEQDTQHKML